MDSISLIKTIFPKSNLNAIFFEVEAEYILGISTWLGYNTHTTQEIEKMTDLSVQIFNEIFPSTSDEIFCLINHWDCRRDIYMLNQFKAFRDGRYKSRISFDETQEKEREQILIQTTQADIDINNIYSTFVERDYAHEPESVTSRIIFINPVKQMYLLYFDSEIIVGGNNLSYLKPIFYKYEEYISKWQKTQFLKHDNNLNIG